jgi:thiol-disulfide isomerase/thioredoxin
MIRAIILTLAWLCVFADMTLAQTTVSGLDSPVPPELRVMLVRADSLAGDDRPEQALQQLNQARSTYPSQLEAHRQYLLVMSNFLGKTDEARNEYESLIASEPLNPVYPLAVALTLDAAGPRAIQWYRKVVELAPDWSWSHFCKAYLTLGRTFVMVNEKFEGKEDQILQDLHKAIEKNPEVADFYTTAIFFEKAMGRLDEAIATAGKMISVSDLRARGLLNLWELHLTQSKGSEAAKQIIRNELATRSAASTDIKLLATIHEAYRDILEDETAATLIEKKIRQIDASWYPQRGKAVTRVTYNLSGSPYLVMAANRQYAIDEKIRAIALRREPDWRKEQRLYEQVLTLRPNQVLQRWLFTILFGRAREAGDTRAMTDYAMKLNALDPTDIGPFSRLALELSKHKTKLRIALSHAQRAERGVQTFVARPCPPGIPTERCEQIYSPKKQQEIFQRQQASALDAVGWVLSRMGRHAEGEVKLRRAVELNRTDASLSHLADVLQKVGKQAESDQLLREIDERLRESVRQQFTNQPSKDFVLRTLDGKEVRLSDLKGKVVLLNFWATWCGPCIAEMPLLNEIYNENKSKGFELLAISGDDARDGAQVKRFAKEHQLNFPVFHDEATVKLYNVIGFPGNIFIDREGKTRYITGAFPSDGRLLRLIVGELIK